MAVEKPEPLKPLIAVSQETPVLSVSQTPTTSTKPVINKPPVEISAKKDPVIKATVIDRKPPPIEPPAPKKPALEARYNELLKLIAEVGKDIKPSYTNGKGHSDRLRKNITTARNVLRECLGELDRLSRAEVLKPTSSEILQ